MKLDQVKPRKAGLMPYVYQDGEPVFMFMVPSDADFGGKKPAIAKGNIDGSESVFEAAVREAEEELGLKKSNMIIETFAQVWRGSNGYLMTVFMCEVKDKMDFNEPHYETGSTHWLTAAEFSRVGKKWQIPIVQQGRLLLEPHVI
jgi:8-oxo-dGTP pyrophosphatase MutT (NUDIX family)